VDSVSRRQTSEPFQTALVPISPAAGRAFPILALDVRDLACARGGRLVFSGVRFRLSAGELLAVTGPNGSGKSSLLRVLAGLLRPEAGSLAFEGAGEDEPLAHYLGHADALKAGLTLREALSFWVALYGGAGRDFAPAVARVGLGHALDLPAAVLSAGQRRRAGLARLLVAPRPVWLLDEPTSALDREGEALLDDMLAEHLAAGGLVVAATHQDLPVAPDQALHLGHAA
jgi:heme exporter protein A